MVSALDFRSEGRWLSGPVPAIVLFPDHDKLRRVPLNIRAISAKNIYQKTTHSTKTF